MYHSSAMKMLCYRALVTGIHGRTVIHQNVVVMYVCMYVCMYACIYGWMDGLVDVCEISPCFLSVPV